MSTTIDELQLYAAKINKFSKFKPVKDLPKEAKDIIHGRVKDVLYQAEDHLTHEGIEMGEQFRKEWEDRAKRARQWLEDGIDTLYLEDSIIKVPYKTLDGKKEVRDVKTQHIISFAEA